MNVLFCNMHSFIKRCQLNYWLEARYFKLWKWTNEIEHFGTVWHEIQCRYSALLESTTENNNAWLESTNSKWICPYLYVDIYEYNVTTTCICFQFHAVNLKDKFYIRISLEFTFAIIRYGCYSALFAWLNWTSVKIKKPSVVGYIAICKITFTCLFHSHALKILLPFNKLH